jgi:hypothetical protein
VTDSSAHQQGETAKWRESNCSIDSLASIRPIFPKPHKNPNAKSSSATNSVGRQQRAPSTTTTTTAEDSFRTKLLLHQVAKPSS